MPPDNDKDRHLELLQEIARLQDEVSYFKTLFDQLPVGVYRTSRSGRFLQANPALAKILGYSQDEIREQRAQDFFADPTDREGQLRRWKAKSEITSDELKFKTKDGREIWVRDTGKAILDENGEINCFDGVIEDITDRKEALEALKESEEQLRQSQKMEALGRLAGGVAHDINNVLGAVMGSASAIRFDFDEDHPMGEDLQNILRACKKGRDLTRNLLGFSRKGKFTRSAISTKKVIEDLLSLLSRSIPNEISVKKNLSEDLRYINGDSTQIGQALMNVCLNALDAMKGEGTLEIRARNSAVKLDDTGIAGHILPGDYVEIIVSDTGEGIDRETLERVFEPFFTTKPKGEGTGLGLSTVYGIVNNHKGSVQMYSRPGRGTQVEFLLPAATDEEVERESQVPELPEVKIKARKKVLLVDDEATILRAHGRMLEQLGFDVIAVSTGIEAMGVFQTQWEEIALVLLDLVMPGMNGDEVFKHLKEMDENVRVVVCSGYTKGEKVNDLLNRGAAGFLQKPFEMEALAKKLSSVIGRVH